MSNLMTLGPLDINTKLMTHYYDPSNLTTFTFTRVFSKKQVVVLGQVHSQSFGL